MADEWIGKAVSIHCDEKLGVFQGIIKDISESEITIVRAFRNGVPLRKQDAEVTLRSTDIFKITLIPSYNGQSTVTPTVINKPTPVKQPNFANVPTASSLSNGISNTSGSSSKPESNSMLTKKISNMKITANGHRRTPTSDKMPKTPTIPPLPQQQQQQQQPQSNNYIAVNNDKISSSTSNSVAQFFGKLIPPKVEVRMGTTFSNCPPVSSTDSYGNSSSKPIDIVNSGQQVQLICDGNNSFPNNTTKQVLNNRGLTCGNGSYNSVNSLQSNNINPNNGGGSQKKARKQLRRENSKQNQTFSTSVDDPILNEDFDFEGNLALFDKQALWNVIEAEQKPDASSQTSFVQPQKYRHDENILACEPLELRQIETMFDGSTDFVTDEGLIIPTIPTFVRSKIESSAERNGLSLQRQNDILARGSTDLAILLLGGARRLTPNNCHQWPTIAIICDRSDNFRVSNIGAATGRQLASHGLKVLLYLEEKPLIEEKSVEISLFKATGNTVVYSVNALPTPDLVILSTNSNIMSPDVQKWLNENRASILSIDPPPNGIQNVPIKYSILPILPLNGISSNNCGKLYLCNLGIPDKFYREAGIKYKSPFGHKFVIPIHLKD